MDAHTIAAIVTILVALNTLSNGAQFLILRDLRDRVMRLETLTMAQNGMRNPRPRRHS